MQAYNVNYLKDEVRAIDPALQADIDYLNANLKGEWGVQGQTLDNRLWLVGNDPVTSPARVMVYDRTAKSLAELYVSRPALAGAALPQVCRWRSRRAKADNLVPHAPVGTRRRRRGPAPLPWCQSARRGPGPRRLRLFTERVALHRCYAPSR